MDPDQGTAAHASVPQGSSSGGAEGPAVDNVRLDPVMIQYAPFDFVQKALGATGRIRYTSVASSGQILALGATTGGLYCFDLSANKLLTILQHKEGQISQVSFSPDGNFVGVGTINGAVTVWEHNLHNFKIKEKKLKTAIEMHKGTAIKQLLWDSESTRVFSGDANGKVGCLQLEHSRGSGASSVASAVTDTVLSVSMNIMDMKILSKSGAILFDAGSSVVQLGYRNGLLLVSTLQRVLIFNTVTRQSQPVGKKPRDGPYGAMFAPEDDILYCARPGSRIWSANAVDGSVTGTLNCKSLFDCESTTFLGESVAEPSPSKGPQSLAMHFLQACAGSFLLTAGPGIIALIDPKEGRLLEWHEDTTGTEELCLRDHKLYCLNKEGNNVMCIGIMEPWKGIPELLQSSNPHQAAEVVVKIFSKLSLADFCKCIEQQVVQQAASNAKGDTAVAIEQIVKDTDSSYRLLELLKIEKLKSELQNRTSQSQEKGDIVLVNDGSTSMVQSRHPSEPVTPAEPVASSMMAKSTSESLELPSASESAASILDQPTAVRKAKQAELSSVATGSGNQPPPVSISTPAVREPIPVASSSEFTTAVLAADAIIATPTKKKKKKEKKKKPPPIDELHKSASSLKPTSDVSNDAFNNIAPTTPKSAFDPPTMDETPSIPILQSTNSTSAGHPQLKEIISVEASPVKVLIDDYVSKSPPSQATTSDVFSPSVSITPSTAATPFTSGTATPRGSPDVNDSNELLVVPKKSRRKNSTSSEKKKRRPSKKAVVVEITEGPAEIEAAMVQEVVSLAASRSSSPIVTPATPRKDSRKGSPLPQNVGFSTYDLEGTADHVSAEEFAASADISVMEFLQIEERVREVNSFAISLADELVGMAIPVDNLVVAYKLKLLLEEIDTTAIVGYQLSERRNIAGLSRAESPIGGLLFQCIELGVFGECRNRDAFIEKYQHCFDPVQLTAYCTEEELDPCLKSIWAYQKEKTDLGKMAILIHKKIKAGADVNSILDLVRNFGSDVGLLRDVLPMLFRYDVNTATSICVEHYPILLPWQVKDTLQGLATINGSDILLKYYDSLVSMKEKFFVDGDMDYSMQYAIILGEFIQLLLSVETPPPSQLFSQDTLKPLEGAHYVIWKKQDEVLQLLANCNTDQEISSLKPDLYKTGFFPGYIMLARKEIDRVSNQTTRKELAELFLDLGDLDGFGETVGLDESLWEHALSVAASTKSSSINTKDLLTRMALKLGPFATVKLLKPLQDRIEVPIELHINLIKARELKKEQNQIRRQILDTLNNHLWSKRPTEVSPQMKSIIDTEMTGDIDSSRFVSKRHDTLSFTPDYMRSPRTQLLTEPLMNWGAISSQSTKRCPVCIMDMSETGDMITFHCGHIFHTQCVPEKACPICFGELRRVSTSDDMI